MATIDSEDELKRRMRRRLVGAVALFTALVIILPMLLEKSPNPHTGKLELRIPDRDKAGAFKTQQVLAESAPEVTEDIPGMASAVPSGNGQSPVSGVPNSNAEAARPQTAKLQPANPQPDGTQASGHAASAVKDTQKTAQPSPAKPPATNAGAQSTPPRKADHPNADTPKTPAQKPGGNAAGFAVQVGAFSHADAAKELQEKLRKAGWHVYTRKSGETIRVRVGTYPGREEAERAQRKLKAQVPDAVVVVEP